MQGLTWPFVELTRHFVQIGLGVHREVGALRKVRSRQPESATQMRSRDLVAFMAPITAGFLAPCNATRLAPPTTRFIAPRAPHGSECLAQQT